MLAKSINYFFEGYKKAFDYKSTSSRAAFWCFLLGYIVLYLPLKIVQALSIQSMSILYSSDFNSLAVNALSIVSSTAQIIIFLLTVSSLACTISLTNRRLRDLGMNTWLTPVFMMPVLNIILPLVFFTRKGA